MKKILFAIASAFVAMGATASNVEKIQFANAGDFSLGIMVGVPPHSDANMPTVSVDGMWGLKDGFINTKTFGQNGAIDLGAYVGFCQYGSSNDYNKLSLWELPIAVRCGFHWEFVKKLDVYAGFQGGVAVCHSMYKDKVADVKNTDNDADGIFGMYLGAKWMFTDAFGVKLEYSGDWINGSNEHGDRWGVNLPPVAAGVTFNF